jgi:hypothetical protein
MIECVFVLSRLRENPGLMVEIEQWVSDNADAGWSRGKSFINGAVFRASVVFNYDADAVAFLLRYGDVVAYTQPTNYCEHSKD